MLDKKQEKKISKRLSLHLRHDPQGLGLSLEPGGWVKVDELLEACEDAGWFNEIEFVRKVVT